MAPKPSVIHVYKDYPPVLGGIEKHIHTLARHQVHRGWDVTVLVTNPAAFPHGLQTQITTEEGIRVIRSGRLFTVASTPISPSQALYQRRLPADVVHLHFPYPPGEVVNHWFGRGNVTVLTYHSDVVRQRGILRAYAPLLRRILRGVHAIIATNPVYPRTSPFLSQVLDRVHIIPLGVDLDPFLQVDPRAARELRESLGKRWVHAPLALFVGKLRYYKGVDILLQALTRVPPLHLWVVGTGPMADAWQRLARRLGLTDRVHFWGEVPESRLPLYYRAADFFVLPATSRAEAFGLVQVEAMATGLPVISTEVGTGTSFVNLHGQTGWVIPPSDPDALAQALRFFMEHPEERQRMGQAARERALREFRAERMAERTLALYERLTSNE